MKKIILLLITIITIFKTHAQTYSSWIIDSKHSNLKIRWATKKDANNYNYLLVQLQNDAEGCKMNITASVCNTDAKDKNGWKFIQLYKNKPATFSFKILNACTNGFWWSYKDYKSTAVKFDDN